MKFSTFTKLTTGTGALAVALASAPAFAQDEGDTTSADEGDAQVIVVTGSISRNPAAATASPIVSITAEDLEKRGVTTVAEAIQNLTANGQGTIPSSWSTWGFTTGATAPSLRGFNNAYTLILFDGMRSAFYPFADDAQRNIVDTNTIPSSIVGRVDTLLDGASATYGSDAIAGVINILPKREIQGLHLAGSLGISQRGDAGEERINGQYGYGDLVSDGFNVYAAIEYSHNDDLFVRERGYPFNTGDWSKVCGTAEQGCNFNAVRNGVQWDDSLNFTSTSVPVVRPYNTDLTDPDPTRRYQLLNPALGCGAQTAYTLTAAQLADNALAPTTVCQEDSIADQSQYAPDIERLGGTLRGTFSLGDSSELWTMFNYYNVKSTTNVTNYGWTGRTAAGGTTVNVARIFLPVYVCSAGVGAVVDDDIVATGCDAGNGVLNPNNPFAADGQVARFYARTPVTRRADTDVKTYRIAAGVNGSFGDVWDYSLGATWSKVNLNVDYDGYIYLQGLLDAVAQGTFDFTDFFANDEAAMNLIFPTVSKKSTSELTQVQATLARDFFELPGGMLNVAVAGGFRHESINNPSANPANDVNPNARFFSLNGIGVAGNRDVWTAAYEITIPLLDNLRLKADGSYDDYSTGQHAFSPKFEAEFRPIEQVKLRGTYSKGFRAPNFNESFQSPATGYTTQQIECTDAAYADFCAAHASNPAYYEGGYQVGLTNSGNPDLKPEKSTSYTFGMVVQPKSNITFTVDYWRTKIRNLISPVSGSDEIYEAYYTNNGVVNVPGITVLPGIKDPENPNALPLLGFIEASFQNVDSLMGKGIDFTVDADFQLTDTISWSSKASGSYLIRLQKEYDDGTIERYDGTLGACGLTSCSGAPRFRAVWQNTLDFNEEASFTLTTTYTSSYSMVATDSGGVYGDCQASADNGQLVTYDNGDPVLCRSKSVLNFDGHGEVKVGDKFTLYADMLNILDTKPDFDPNAAYGIYGFNPAWSDRLFVGRYFRVGAKVDF